MIAVAIGAFVAAERLALLSAGIDSVQRFSGRLLVRKASLRPTGMFLRTKDEGK
jgi:hypothetical protein